MVNQAQANYDWKHRWPAQLSHVREVGQYALQAGLLAHYKPSTVLDIGCGTGNLLRFLSQDTAHIFYTGVDISDVAILEARRNYPRKTFVVADARALPADLQYDCVLTNSVNYLSENPMQHVAPLVKPTGLLFLTCYNSCSPALDGFELLQSFEIRADFPHWWQTTVWRKHG